MAEKANKRQSLNGKVAVPLKAPAQSANAAPANLSRFPNALELQKHIGYNVTITNTLGRDLKGVIYACDNGELVLDAKDAGYHVMPTSRITAMIPHGLDGQRAQQSQTERPKPKKEEVPRPKGVSDIGWGVFVGLKKTLPVRFSERTIVVLDSVLIEPPYGAENCKAPQRNQKELQRVKELVAREREKLTKDNTLGRRGG